jgi:hypothetical protein
MHIGVRQEDEPLRVAEFERMMSRPGLNRRRVHGWREANRRMGERQLGPLQPAGASPKSVYGIAERYAARVYMIRIGDFFVRVGGTHGQVRRESRLPIRRSTCSVRPVSSLKSLVHGTDITRILGTLTIVSNEILIY